jgi:type I restriction enzyme M protein
MCVVGSTTSWLDMPTNRFMQEGGLVGHNLKSIKARFKEHGVFYTDDKLAELLKSYMPDDLASVYDPTCGDGALLAQFRDEVFKYGQELDPEQADAAKRRLKNCCIAAGDTLAAPNFIGMKFRGIVANPPFSVKWEPKQDWRFSDAPCLAPKSRADYAFLLHCLSYLADDGVAAVLNFPGILYRGNSEGRIRQWMVEQNVVDEVVAIEGGYFVDTSIATALLILKKNRTTTDIKFTDHALNLSRVVSVDEVKSNGFTLSVSQYVQPPRQDKPSVNPLVLEERAQEHAIRKIKAELMFSKMVCQIEGMDFNSFCDRIIAEVNNVRNEKIHL